MKKIRRILFPHPAIVGSKQVEDYVKRIVGQENVLFYGSNSNDNCPCAEIRCSKKKWKEIKNKLHLVKGYW